MGQGSGSDDPLATTVTAASPTPGDAATPDPALAPGTLLGGRYTILRFLGAGGMGTVSLAVDVALGKQVALKQIHPRLRNDPEAIARVRAEVLLAQKVTHTNVCRTNDLEEIDGLTLVKMEYVAGPTLAERLSGGAVPVREAVEIARQIARGLEAAHAQGVIHCDLKPQNVLLEETTQRVVLMDFGVSRAIRSGASPASGGTPAYMAPEVWSGGDVDGRADLYALGCVMHQMLTGERPFRASTPSEWAEQHRSAPAPELKKLNRRVPQRLSVLVRRLLEKDPARRPADAAAVIAWLAPPRRRWPWIAAALLTVGAVAALLGLRPSATEWRPVTRTHLPTFDENSNGLAFSPDGRSLLYSSDRESFGQLRLYLAPVEGGAGRVVSPPTMSVEFARFDLDGRSLLATELYREEAYRLPLPEGPPVLLARDARAVVPCGDALVFLGSRQIVRHSADGNTRVLVEVPMDQRPRSLGCDRPGRQLVYDLGPFPRLVQGPSDLWLLSLAPDGALSGPPRQLTNNPSGENWDASFAEDGASVVFSSLRGEYVNVWELPVAGGDPVQRTFDEGPDYSPQVSPDGKLLAYDVDVTSFPLFARSLSEGEPRRITAAMEGIAALSPTHDGREIIAAAERSGVRAIVAIPLDGGPERDLARGNAPTVSEDDREVFFAADEQLWAVPRSGGRARLVAKLPGTLMRQTASTGALHLSIATPAGAQAWRVSPAGAQSEREAPDPWVHVDPAARGGWRAATLGQYPQFMTYLIPPGAALEKRGSSFENRAAVWDAAGRSMVYLAGDEIRRRFVDGRDERLLTIRLCMDMAPSGDGQTIYFSRALSHVRRQIITNWADRPRPWRR